MHAALFVVYVSIELFICLYFNAIDLGHCYFETNLLLLALDSIDTYIS